MAMVLLCIFTCIAFYVCFGITNGDIQERYTRKLNNLQMINVDKSNQSSFSSIQAAIDSVPSNNKNWITISIKSGVYNEQVKIPPDKPFIYLKGEGIGKTNVTWGASDTMLTSATFASMSDNILVSGITFVNSYNYPPSNNGNPAKPALAAMISGDKSAFYECSFLGYQDTLLDDVGRHYFSHCTIEGAIDFIFGNGQSIYERCTISVNIGLRSPELAGFIAAQARESPNSGSGFVFKQCKVTGKGNVFLGRAWKVYSRVIFYNSFLSDIVVPQGWDAWTFVGHEKNITFAEEQCQGPGSGKLKRVNWEQNMRSEDLKSFTSNTYIDNDGWIRKLPLY